MKKTISLLLALCILTFAALPAFAVTNPSTNQRGRERSEN